MYSFIWDSLYVKINFTYAEVSDEIFWKISLFKGIAIC